MTVVGSVATVVAAVVVRSWAAVGLIVEVVAAVAAVGTEGRRCAR